MRGVQIVTLNAPFNALNERNSSAVLSSPASSSSTASSSTASSSAANVAGTSSAGPSVSHRTAINQTVARWYLDRLGKLERYRRQIYALALTPYSEGLWLGTLTLIEWAKDLEELEDASAPAFTRDTTQVYLVTSRDGVSVDTSWVYAHRPLLPKHHLTQRDWGSGFLLPAAQWLTDASSHGAPL